MKHHGITTMNNCTQKVIPILWDFFKKRQHRITGINVTTIENELIISILTKKNARRFIFKSTLTLLESLNGYLKTF
jgi:hypothetical protein